ncbi:MAG: tRNA uridine-5-carboxymethylaminomethyl(34) synthesis GTPase MnmE [SAR86 cluster bacterium]|uniref:tRNA modification GTPase MnmE n=1 Tax=SAR86 cluster bacterium TaxID=2030880 RepID=A0A2A5AYH8_9GAMM|nr:MAG: tRNA uridine-5-carboxymethylaminomethyl(34) synthesis GTPase MnmE [SAR86 cluster bacterium]
MPLIDTDTICAIATPPGRSGVGIVRISGPEALSIAVRILGFTPKPRYAHYSDFLNTEHEVIDQGIALFFKQPHSFTGEDVIELQGHGGVYVQKALLDTVISSGARLARPGEFSERSFLNNKIDLLQAEAIADLIDSSSQQAARSAIRTLQGEFSQKIHTLLQQLVSARVNVEAAIDFSDEDIDIVSDTGVKESLLEILSSLVATLSQAQQGALLKEGINVVIAGKPNAGKSSLLNALSGLDSAIVTDIPGTTRDLLTEKITIDGMPVHIIDTAGLRASEDIVEKEGVRRAQVAIEQADQILLVIDKSTAEQDVEKLLAPLVLLSNKSVHEIENLQNTTLVFNKIDLVETAQAEKCQVKLGKTELTTISLSAKHAKGMDLLKEHLKTITGFNSAEEGAFVARERHLIALRNTKQLIESAMNHINDQSPLELIAEDLRLAQAELGTITGEFSSDDLLGEIFSNFCVGK